MFLLKPLIYKKDGFTLVEVIVAVVLLSLLAALALRLVSSSHLMNQTAGQRLDAVTIAQKYIEEYRRLNVKNMSPPVNHTETPSSGINYSVKVEWPQPITSSQKIVELAVYVSWLDGYSRPHSYGIRSHRNL